MPYNWNEQAGQFRQQGGIRNALRTPTSGLGRLTNALGQALFGPAGGLGANAIFNGIQRGADSRVTPMHGDTGWGFGMTPASTTEATPLSQGMQTWAEQEGMSTQPVNQNAAAAGAQQPTQNTQQQINNLPSAMRQWIGQNGLPQTPNDIRRATNAMYLEGATNMANSNYGQDIGFIAPQARAPRER